MRANTTERDCRREALGRALRKGREDAGLSQADVGARVGVCHSVVQQWESPEGAKSIAAHRVPELGPEACVAVATWLLAEGGAHHVVTAAPEAALEPASIASMSTVLRECSDVSRVHGDALADGDMTDVELEALDREIGEALEALQRLRNGARAELRRRSQERREIAGLAKAKLGELKRAVGGV